MREETRDKAEKTADETVDAQRTAAGSLGIALLLATLFWSPFVVIWLRVAYPRLREDQLQRLCWQVLVPLALAQLVLTVGVKVWVL